MTPTTAGDAELSTSAMVTGYLYGASNSGNTPVMLTEAITKMETAYTYAASRPNPKQVGRHSGSFPATDVLEPGIYKWSGVVTVPVGGTVTFDGSAADQWIMQIAGNLEIGTDATILLTNGAKAENIFWAVAGDIAVGVNAHAEGIFLTATMIAMKTRSSLNGAAYAQTEVTLDAATVINDTTDPILLGVPANIEVECTNVPPKSTDVTVTDIGNNPVGPVIFYNEVLGPGSCKNGYILIRTWTAVDACGNTVTAVQTITAIIGPSGPIDNCCDTLLPAEPSVLPSETPSVLPSRSKNPSVLPSDKPSVLLSNEPSKVPSGPLGVFQPDQPSVLPSVSTNPSTSSLPSVSTSPSISTHPSLSSMPSDSLKPSISVNPSVSTNPSMSSLPSVSTKPSLSRIIIPVSSDEPSFLPSDEPSKLLSEEPSVLPSVLPNGKGSGSKKSKDSKDGKGKSLKSEKESKNESGKGLNNGNSKSSKNDNGKGSKNDASVSPLNEPSVLPSDEPSVLPSDESRVLPSNEPSKLPSDEPSVLPSVLPKGKVKSSKKEKVSKNGNSKGSKN